MDGETALLWANFDIDGALRAWELSAPCCIGLRRTYPNRSIPVLICETDLRVGALGMLNSFQEPSARFESGGTAVYVEAIRETDEMRSV